MGAPPGAAALWGSSGTALQELQEHHPAHPRPHAAAGSACGNELCQELQSQNRLPKQFPLQQNICTSRRNTFHWHKATGTGLNTSLCCINEFKTFLFSCACKSQGTCVQLHHLHSPISILVLPFPSCSQGHSQDPHGGKKTRIHSVREAIFKPYIFRQPFILSGKSKATRNVFSSEI